MSEPKPHYKPNGQGHNGRARFTLPDLIRALQGFGSPEGYIVIPNDIGNQVLAEIERLYGIEDTAVALLAEFGPDSSPSPNHPAVLALSSLVGEP